MKTRQTSTATRNLNYRQRKGPVNGNSLIEVLAALLLASILMVSVLQLLKNLHSRERIVDRAISSHAAWQDRLFQLLQRDLRNGRRIRMNPGQVEVEGHCGTDESTGIADLSDVVVTWKVIRTPTTTQLIRDEQSSVVSNNFARRQVIAIGISNIGFWYQEAPDVSYLHESAGSAVSGTGTSVVATTGSLKGWAPIPKAMICRIDFDYNHQSLDVRRTMVMNSGGPR